MSFGVIRPVVYTGNMACFPWFGHPIILSLQHEGLPRTCTMAIHEGYSLSLMSELLCSDDDLIFFFF
jgi:hypothetical protein